MNECVIIFTTLKNNPPYLIREAIRRFVWSWLLNAWLED